MRAPRGPVTLTYPGRIVLHMATTAGDKALSEIRANIEGIIAVLDQSAHEFGEEETKEQVVADLLSDITRRFEGSYWYGGANGWATALANPTEKPFDVEDWR